MSVQRAVTLLALSDSGVPSYDENLAKKLRALGIPDLGKHVSRVHPDGLEVSFLARGQQTYRVNDRIYRLRGLDRTMPVTWIERPAGV